MKRLPNVISVLRVAGSIGQFFCDVAGWKFWALYALCGISDMAACLKVFGSYDKRYDN